MPPPDDTQTPIATEDTGDIDRTTAAAKGTPSSGGDPIAKASRAIQQEERLREQEQADPKVQAALQRESTSVDKAISLLDKVGEGFRPMGDDVKAWDTKKEMAEHTTNPLQTFGSAAMVFASLASAFTHQPITNSLNAGAAVLNAVRSQDEEGYNKAYEAWKANTDLAFKRHEAETNDLKAILELAKTAPALAEAQFKAATMKYGMAIEGKQAEASDWLQLAQSVNAREAIQAQLAMAQGQLMKEHEIQGLTFDYNRKYWGTPAGKAFAATPEGQAFIKAHPNGEVPDSVTRQSRLQAMTDVQKAESPYGDLRQQIGVEKLEDAENAKFNARQEVKDFRETRDAKSIAENLLAHPETVGMGDYAIMFAYLKGLNPKATVRMSEITAAEDTASLRDKIERLVKKAAQGNKLAREQLDAMVDVIKQDYGVRQKNYERVRNDYITTAKGRGLNVENIIGIEDEGADPSASGDTGAGGAAPAAAPQITIKRIN